MRNKQQTTEDEKKIEGYSEFEEWQQREKKKMERVSARGWGVTTANKGWRNERVRESGGQLGKMH